MKCLFREEFSRPRESFFEDQKIFEPWNADTQIADRIDPIVSSAPRPLCRLALPDEVPEGRLAVTGFLTSEPLVVGEGTLLVRAEFRPLASGSTGEHLGIFCRAHNPEDAARGSRFGVAIQNGENPSGQCPGSSAFLQFTSGFTGVRAGDYGHDFHCFELCENPFMRGLGKTYRLEFEEIQKGGTRAWEGRVYRRTLLGWSLRGLSRVTESELKVRVPSLPAKTGLGLGPGCQARVDLLKFEVFSA
jgi:hypothetical protein